MCPHGKAAYGMCVKNQAGRDPQHCLDWPNPHFQRANLQDFRQFLYLPMDHSALVQYQKINLHVLMEAEVVQEPHSRR